MAKIKCLTNDYHDIYIEKMFAFKESLKRCKPVDHLVVYSFFSVAITFQTVLNRHNLCFYLIGSLAYIQKNAVLLYTSAQPETHICARGAVDVMCIHR